MPSLKFHARRFSDRAFGTAFERALAKSVAQGTHGFLFFWNRGLGDIALGLVPLYARIREVLPRARIVVITREELRAAFEMTDVDAIHVMPGLAREARIDIHEACGRLGLDPAHFATVFDYPDPNRWLEGKRLDHPPRLRWPSTWDALADALMPKAHGGLVTIGAHVNSETARYYGYRKDWAAERWQELFARFPADRGVQWVLLGYEATHSFAGGNLVDLRGKTDFPSLLSVIRHRLRVLVAPDSGVLTMAYYIDAPFALDIVSLWADPRQGVLHQGCPSPNAKLRHTALVSPGEDIRNLAVDTVAGAVVASLA